MQVHNTTTNLLASHITCIWKRLTVCRTLTFTQSAEGPISTTMVSVLDAEKPICPSLPTSTSIEATIFYLLNYLFICCVRIFSRKINWIKLIISYKQDNQQMQLQWHSTSSQSKFLILFFHWYIHTPQTHATQVPKQQTQGVVFVDRETPYHWGYKCIGFELMFIVFL